MASKAQLIRSKNAMMKYKATGNLPKGIKPSSPLITYLESLPPRKRVQMHGVKLNPSLGYNTSQIFPNAQMLLLYLKPQAEMTKTWPADNQMIHNFNQKITDEIFEESQKMNIGEY